MDALQPDFTLTAMPTTLRMPRHKLAFRVTHRFGRPLGQGDFGDLVSDFFGLDSGAQIGLELRYGLARGTQIGVHRTSDRTTQIFGQHNFLNQRDGKPIGLDASRRSKGPTTCAPAIRARSASWCRATSAGALAVYGEPFLVVNTNGSSGQGWDNNTLMVGLGARARLLSAMYLVAEISPRLSGYDPGVSQISFGLEGRAGGHQFQINVSNGAGTTMGQIASGAGQQRQLVSRLQPVAQVFLRSCRYDSRCPDARGAGGGDRGARDDSRVRRRLPLVAVDNPPVTGNPGPSGATITIGANGAVSPSQVQIATGQSVTWINNDSRSHDMSSDPHPAHTDCPQMNAVSNISPGQTKLTNAFPSARTCGFHDHNSPTSRR